MKREGMLYRYLRDYTPSSPMQSPLDSIPYDLEPDYELLDVQHWWGDQSTLTRRESSPGMDTTEPSPIIASVPSGTSVPPITIPETVRRTSTASNNGEQIYISPTNTMGSMLPPMVPQLARMKRKGT